MSSAHPEQRPDNRTVPFPQGGESLYADEREASEERRLQREVNNRHIFRRERETLQEAEMLLAQGEEVDPATTQEAFRTLTSRYRALLHQAEKITSISDVTQHQLVRTRNQLRDSIEDVERLNTFLRELNREKNEFLGITAHDLKSPLAAIRGMAEMIESQDCPLPPEELSEYAREIRLSSTRMLGLVSDLLDVNRIEEGTLQTLREVCDVGEVLRARVRDYLRTAREKEISLQVPDSFPSLRIIGDRTLLPQVFDNLISNAIKYSPIGSNIYVNAWQESTFARVRVQDEGPGIPKAEQRRLFRKFSRLSTKPTGGESSTGLGLAIAKRIVDDLDGDIWCESEVGQGAAFHVRFPIVGPTSRELAST